MIFIMYINIEQSTCVFVSTYIYTHRHILYMSVYILIIYYLFIATKSDLSDTYSTHFLPERHPSLSEPKK